MRSSTLEELRECCDNSKSYLIVYDGANTAHLPILVCDLCIKEMTFHKYVVAKYTITNKTDVDKILEKFWVD